MKKLAAAVLSVAVFLFCLPLSAHASSDETQVIDTHGSKTYQGSYSDWDDRTWDADNFTDVTGEDIDTDNDLIIKGGTVGNVDVGGESDLQIYSGTMSDVTCDGDISMSGGKADSLDAQGDARLSDGTVVKDVKAEDGTVTLSGKVSVGGEVDGQNVTVYATGSSRSVNVKGTVSFSGNMDLEGPQYSFGGIDGQSSGTLELKRDAGTLPAISSLTGLSMDSGSQAVTSHALNVDTLSLADGSELCTSSTVAVGTLSGPGVLSFRAGSLTVNSGISSNPVFVLQNNPPDGSTVFQAKAGTVSANQATIFGYGLSESSSGSNSGDYHKFILQAASGAGVKVTPASTVLPVGKSATVKASVTPPLSQLPDGTKLSWKLIDPSGNFSITPQSDSPSCIVNRTASQNSAGPVTLAAYLSDINGNLLPGYATGVCTLTASGSSSLSLDTQAVSIPVGSTYSVLAVTDLQTPPVQMSYNSSIAIVGKAKAYSCNGKSGWLYPITALSKGGVTIAIGDQKVSVTVPGGSIAVDTSSYTMSPGSSYTIGVRLYGVGKSSLNVHSANSCTTVQEAGTSAGGIQLYRVHANSAGTGYVLFDTSAGGKIQTRINVVSGVSPSGVSARLVAAT